MPGAVTAARRARLVFVVTCAASVHAYADDPLAKSNPPTEANPPTTPAEPSKSEPTKTSDVPSKSSGDQTTAPSDQATAPDAQQSGRREVTSPTPATPPASTAKPTDPGVTAKKDDDEGTPKLSLPTEADREAWQRSGFRLGLGLLYGDMVGLRGAPSGRLLGPWVRFGLRLDADWSVLASFQYVSASKSGGLSGLRFAGTIDPTWHATRNLSLALGFGFGGIVEGRTGRPDVDPLPSTLDTSYTFPDARMPIPSCSGVGAAGVARAEWAMVLGPRSSTSISIDALGQWTGCVEDTRRVEPDTGRPIVRRQWWPHTGATVSWGITWR
jgi:hypothetical protein